MAQFELHLIQLQLNSLMTGATRGDELSILALAHHYPDAYSLKTMANSAADFCP